MVARGMSNRELAAELVISEATVKTHVKAVPCGEVDASSGLVRYPDKAG
jgi:FixJ family two-component response regulator